MEHANAVTRKGESPGLLLINPLGLKSDQHQIFPCNIIVLYTRVVMRIKDMITQDESY